MAVVLITTVATLAIAAVLVLGPLEKSLRSNGESQLRKAIPETTVRRLQRLPMGQMVSGKHAIAQLQRATRATGREAGGAFVTVLGDQGLDGRGARPIGGTGTSAPDDDFSDVAYSLRTRHRAYQVVSIGGSQYASAVIPFRVREVIIRLHRQGPRLNPHAHELGQPGRPDLAPPRWDVTERWYALVVRRSISEIPSVVNEVTRAFLEAAAAGLALTLILGIGLSGRLVARLRRLRRAAVELEREGPASVVPVDRTRDEVGDLARALSAMQEHLRVQEQARRAFVATASHELRTPLTSLDGMLELLHDDLEYPDPDLADARDLVARARAQSRRLGRLAADLLDLSRMDAQVDLRSEPVELGEISRAVLAEFDLGASERAVSLELELLSESVWALGDPGSIARILRILVDNAMRVSPSDSEIRIRLRGGTVVMLSVCDEGPGVAEEDREAIFQRFQRGRDTTGKAGFGLGLAIGRELARRMGGELALEPAGEIGATFTLSLPVAPAGDRNQQPRTARTAGR